MLLLQGAQVKSLVGELRSLMPHGVAKKKRALNLALNPVDEWSPTFLAPGTSFMEDSFSMDGVVGQGWFGAD